MVIQHNISALNSHRNLGINNSATAKNLEKLSSGYRINRAGDDAAGLAISEKMRGQIRGLAMAEQNTENGISLIQTAEGGLNETHAILQRMRELSVQASNGTYQDDDRKQIAIEVQALKDEIDRIASSTHYNGIKLLDGSLGGFEIKEDSTQADIEAAFYKAFGNYDNTATNPNANTSVKSLGDLLLNATISINAAMLAELGLNEGDVIDARIVISDSYLQAEVQDAEQKSTGTPADTLKVVDIRQISIQIGDKTYKLAEDSGNMVFKDDETGGTITLTGITNTDLQKSVTSAGVISGIEIEVQATGTPTTENVNQEGAMVTGLKDELIFQIGANGGADQRVGLHVFNMSTAYLGTDETLLHDISILTRDEANDAIKVIDAATNQVSAQRAGLGALQNRLEHTLNNLGVTKENLTAAESTIRDVDMAKEMMEFTKNNILVQASQAMLAQANALPQGILSLLR